MSETNPDRAHLITGGFPPGSLAGHDHDYARLQLLGLLAERDMPATVANDYADLEKWLPSSRLLISYVAGPYPDAGQCRALQGWLEAGGHWLGLHGASGGRAARGEGTRQTRPPSPPRLPLSAPPADPQDQGRGQRRRSPDHPRARRLVRGRRRALFHRAARSGLDAGPVDRGLRPR